MIDLKTVPEILADFCNTYHYTFVESIFEEGVPYGSCGFIAEHQQDALYCLMHYIKAHSYDAGKFAGHICTNFISNQHQHLIIVKNSSV